jgi:putative transposase
MKSDIPLTLPQPSEDDKIRVLVVDDHTVVRQGLRMFIEMQGDMEVVGEGSNGVEARGVDVHKQTPGRKRHLIVDVLGLVLLVVVHSASIQDGAGGLLTLQKLFDQIKRSVHNRWCRLKLIWADGAYTSILETVRQRFGWVLEIVKRSDDVKGFKVLPHRWVVERTFGWLGRYRRLARDYEHTTSSSENMVYIASIRRMLKMVAP